MTRTEIPPHLAEFHQRVMDEAHANGLRLRTERRQIRRAKIAYGASFLLLLVGSLALGDVTVAQAFTSIQGTTSL